MNEDKLKEVIGDAFDIDEDDINEETSNETVERWDSLNHLRLVTALESEFNITLTMDDINSMNSYPAIVALMAERLNT